MCLCKKKEKKSAWVCVHISMLHFLERGCLEPLSLCGAYMGVGDQNIDFQRCEPPVPALLLRVRLLSTKKLPNTFNLKQGIKPHLTYVAYFMMNFQNTDKL